MPVESGTTCAAAIETAESAAAGALVVTKDGRTVGIVRNSALAAVPEAQRPEVAIDAAARRIGGADRIPADRPIGNLAEWLQNVAADEWLLVEADGRIFGVLIRSDLAAVGGNG